MSSSSRFHGESDSSRVELPVFVTPGELILSTNIRRSLLTVFNPYGTEAQFRLMTTSPDRFDVSVTKGTIKPNRRIDITIRLLSQKIDELPEPNEELQTIDYFRIILQAGNLKGSKSIKVHWCLNTEALDIDDSRIHLISGVSEKSSKLKLKSLKSPISNQSLQLSGSDLSSSSHNQQHSTNQRSSIARPSRHFAQVDNAQGGSNVNLVCTMCAIACVATLFLPLSVESELCKKVKSIQEQSLTKASGMISQIAAFLSVSYEMKLGCSFALGLFTYRLISTLPD